MIVPTRAFTLTCAATVIAGCVTHHPMTAQEKFAYRVEEYVEMRHQAERRAGPVAPTADAAALNASTENLRSMIERFRSGLTRGVILSGDVADEFRRTLAARLGQPDGETIVRALQAVPSPPSKLSINDTYPEGGAVESMPPSLLAVLPPLPPVLIYRFVGRDLFLIDRDTRLIVDILREALPPLH